MIDKQKIEELLLNGSSSIHQIAKEIGVTRATLNGYRTGDKKVENMTLGMAEKLMSYIQKEEKEMEMEQAIKKFLNEAWENLLWNGMEIVLFKDGENWIRQQGSFGEVEENVIYTLSLDPSYWSDSYVLEDGEKDVSSKEDFMSDMYSEVFWAVDEYMESLNSAYEELDKLPLEEKREALTKKISEAFEDEGIDEVVKDALLDIYLESDGSIWYEASGTAYQGHDKLAVLIAQTGDQELIHWEF